MNPENTILSGKKQTRKVTWHRINFVWNVQNWQICELERRSAVSRARRREEGDCWWGQGLLLRVKCVRTGWRWCLHSVGSVLKSQNCSLLNAWFGVMWTSPQFKKKRARVSQKAASAGCWPATSASCAAAGCWGYKYHPIPTNPGLPGPETWEWGWGGSIPLDWPQAHAILVVRYFELPPWCITDMLWFKTWHQQVFIAKRTCVLCS